MALMLAPRGAATVRRCPRMPVGVNELLLAGLVGLSELDDEDIIDLISDMRDAAGSSP